MHCHEAWSARVLLTLLASLMLLGCFDTEPASPPPSVVVIVTDDQAFSTLPFMPLVAKHLATEGTTLENFILNDPICCPSRVTILLGQYRHNHHQETGWPGCASLFHRAGSPKVAIGNLMREAGYRTGMVGKYLNSYGAYFLDPNREPGAGLMLGWDDYRTITSSTKYRDFQMDENGEIVSYPKAYQTDVLAKHAVRFIDESSAVNSPFFLYVTPQAPHRPVRRAKRHRRHYARANAPRPPSFGQIDRASQPSLSGVKGLSDKAKDRIDSSYRHTLQALQAVDELVRDVVLALERTGRLENTYIFFTSDNGLHFGEHGIETGKGTPFEESIRFPLIVRGPGIPRGVSLATLASNVDLHPTLLELLGNSPGPRVDGRSLLPLLRGSNTARRRNSLVIESDHERRNSGVPRFRGIRTERYKLIEYVTGDVELYDLAVDRHETKSVLGTTPPALVEGLRARLDALAHCVGADCRRVEDLPLPHGADSPQSVQ
jgi:N-acetylglucosamine-6-sulfatase